MLRKAVLSLTLVLVLVMATGAVSGASSSNARVYVIHGINGSDLGLPTALPVDIAIDGACAIEGFEFGDIEYLMPPAGTYSVAIYLDGGSCAGSPVIGPASLNFAAGSTYHVVAHLTDSGAPTASLFDVSSYLMPTGKGSSRLVVAHTAWAPAVDAVITRDPFNAGSPTYRITDFANGEQAGVSVKPGTWFGSLEYMGSTVFGPAQFAPARPGMVYFGYVVGSAGNSSLSLISLADRAGS
jgi:hypothetical protein